MPFGPLIFLLTKAPKMDGLIDKIFNHKIYLKNEPI